MTEYKIQDFKIYRKTIESGEDKVDEVFRIENGQEVMGIRGLKSFLTAVLRAVVKRSTKIENEESNVPVSLVKREGEFEIELGEEGKEE